MPTLKIVLSTALCAVLLASPAHAEKADRDKPVNIEANTVTLDDIKKISIYQGNVILSQGTLMLRA
ncbi:MAG: LptA/OstA family protein, partial [Thiobacillus sp.]|nr:LptA/OstA family protein [Thiobacillus sp.]